MDEPTSLVIEIFGLKATALGTLPVIGLLMLMGFAIVAGPTQLLQWAKRLRKPTDE